MEQPMDQRQRESINSNVEFDQMIGDGDESSRSLNTKTDTASTQAAIKESDLIALKETQQLCWLRGIVLVALLLATLMVSIVIYYSTRQGEVEQFKTQFEDNASKMLDNFQFNVEQGITAIDNFGVTLTSFGKRSAFNWPYAVIPDFAVRAASTRNMASASFCGLLPLVTGVRREAWERFSLEFGPIWTEDGKDFEESIGDDFVEEVEGRRLQPLAMNPGAQEDIPVEEDENGIPTKIYRVDMEDGGTGEKYVDDGPAPFFPAWQHSPVSNGLVNFNIFSHPDLGAEAQLSIASTTVVLGQASRLHPEIDQEYDPMKLALEEYRPNEPVFTIHFPLLDDYTEPREEVAIIAATIYWRDYLALKDFDETTEGMTFVLLNGCGQAYTFQVSDQELVFVTEGDGHNPSYDYMEESVDLRSVLEELYLFSGISVDVDYCPYSLRMYPTSSFEDRYYTNQPWIYTGAVVAVFVFTSLVFVGYDYLVERRQKVVMKTAVKSHQIVSSLFPAVVRNRLFGDEGSEQGGHGGKKKGAMRPLAPKAQLKGFLNDQEGDSSKPIADLFPYTTVLFADIAGFTAWSSVREPAQVFVLLETLYAAFDKIAAYRKVFKVETIGDCYVAVTGLPDPQPDHAVIMARFASQILMKMLKLTSSLERELGPDTADLALRIGLHSGPVTAGVLRGQKSRFQLFGDTVNTASRMESNGKPRHIQCSEATGDLLIDAGKSHWLLPRQDLVHAKGKGKVKTYWVNPRSRNEEASESHMSESGSVGSSGRDEDDDGSVSSDGLRADGKKKSGSDRQKYDLKPQMKRLIGWNVDLLAGLIKNIIAHRYNPASTEGGTMKAKILESTKKITNLPGVKGIKTVGGTVGGAVAQIPGVKQVGGAVGGAVMQVGGAIKGVGRGGTSAENSLVSSDGGSDFDDDDQSFSLGSQAADMPRDEYSRSIVLPRFDKEVAKSGIDPEDIELSDDVMDQLSDYVTTIALSYHENPFHNFEHASHVTMSATKILKRVVQADDANVGSGAKEKVAAHLHDFTYGITSDPLTHFACVFSALVHDVDHPGVSNMTLIQEKTEVALAYRNKSVAEQNSVDLAWNLLMDETYADLRKVLFSTEEELRRFRQLLVNSVMATDIFDPELKAMRNDRWEEAFSGSNESGVIDLRATIVIEHIIQAADIAHTMQHWHVYQKWNRRLFEEMYRAYRNGRAGDRDPSDGWYKGELWFYDNYIIPLANKLKECGVFGVASDEFLNYALQNRKEWEERGDDIVSTMVEEVSSQYGARK